MTMKLVVLISLIFFCDCKQIKIPLVKRNTSSIRLIASYMTNLLSGGYPEMLSNFMNTQYYGEVGVGSPPQFFQFMFDTGSADAWVLSKTCGLQNIPCIIHWNKYDHKKSKSYEPVDARFTLPYAQGNVSGFLSVDKFTMGNLEVNNQYFGEVDTISLKFVGMRFGGIIGLGFESLSGFDKKPFFYNLIEQDKTMDPIFSVYLGSKSSKKSLAGEIVFGGYDQDHFKAPLRPVPVVSDRYWAIHVDGVTVDSFNACPNSCKAIVDTGTSLIIGPEFEITRLNQKLGAKLAPIGSIYYFDCEKLDKLENVTFIINGLNYPISKNEYVLKVAGQCISAFMGMPLDSNSLKNIWILGDVFLRKYYTVFNVKERTISFAEAV